MILQFLPKLCDDLIPIDKRLINDKDKYDIFDPSAEINAYTSFDKCSLFSIVTFGS